MDNRVHPDNPSALPPIHVSGAKTSQPIVTFEALLSVINPLGRWQAMIFVCIAYSQYFQSMTNLAVIFFGIQPEFICSQPDLIAANWTFSQIQNISTPVDPENDNLPNGCKVRNLSYNVLSSLGFDQVYEQVYQLQNVSEIGASKCRSGFVFDTSVDMTSTIVTQWELVCDRSFLVEHSQSVYMAGFLVGSFTSGIISDAFGRKLTFIVSALVFTGLAVAQAFVPSYPLFLAVRFFMALFNIASTMASFCLALEVCTARWRIWIGGLFFIPYALGYTSLAAFAFWLRDWRTLQWVIAVPTAAVAFFFWILPESPRWLLVKGRTKEAEAIIRNAAKMNRAEIPHSLDLEKIAEHISAEAKEEASRQVSFIEVFKNRTMTLRTLNLFFNWFVNSAVYYGVSLNVSQFAGNRFLNNGAAGAVEIPAYAMCVPLLYWGRKRSLALMLLLAGVSLIIAGVLPDEPFWVRMAVALVGKLGITASFALVYVLTLELFPTPVRTAGVSNSSCVARLGSILAPYLAGVSKLGAHLRWVPVLVFGALSLGAAALTLFLPETRGKKLPDTFEEAIHLRPEKSTALSLRL